MAIHSCKDCVAPKRYPGCHGSCAEYLTEKAEHDRLKAEYDKRERISAAIYSDRSLKVYKALRGNKK